MRSLLGIVLLIAMGLLTACGGKSSSAGSSRGAKVDVDQNTSTTTTSIGTLSWLFSGFPYPFEKDNGFDAVTYLSGTMRLKAVPMIDGFALKQEEKVLAANLLVKKYLLLAAAEDADAIFNSLSDDEKNLLNTYCRNMQVVLPDGSSAGTIGQDEFEIQWKSHFPLAMAEKLAVLLLATKIDFRCGLEFGMAYEGAAGTNYMSLSFDPAPDFDPTKVHPADLYTGTDRFIAARDEAIMLPETRDHKLDPFSAEWHRIELNEPGEIKSLVALNGDDLSKEPFETAAGDLCEFRLTDTLKVLNPTVAQTVSYKFPPVAERSFVLKSAGYTQLAGVTSPEVCKAMEFTVLSADSFSYKATCAQLKEIVDVGLCGAILEFSNPDDQENSAFVKMTLGGLTYNQVDLTKPGNAAIFLPEAATNPVRNDLVTMTQFSVGQETQLARSFDLWQAVSPTTYETFFNGKINEMIYDNGGPNCTGAGAYAFVPSDKIYWCPGGGLLDDAITLPKSPYYLVYRATTALHEALHANGNFHDIDAPGNLPCSSDAGTAYSAIVAVDTYECTEDFCYGFKELAKEEFILELNYSLKNDARRFQGQCDIWAKKLGVTL